jgi:hypothetical protein
MADHQESRIAALEAKVQELDALVNLTLRLLSVEKPISAVLERYGATGFVGELFERFPLRLVSAEGWPKWI